jgi:type I restriction-modification system DNA methylase subunit
MENGKPSLVPSDADRMELRALVAQFGENIEEYKDQKYNEDRVRSEFIDKFFRLLGWDMGNDTGTGEVIRQDDVKISGRTKKPDYGFYIGKNLKFFLEAKKPAVDIKGGASPAEQIRLYGWNKKLPISILTDFEEFAVYDTRIKPKSGATKKEPASVARPFYCTFREYEEKFDEIYALCSRGAVAGGSLDAFAGKTKGSSEVDADLLQQIEIWRMSLAKNIYKHNENLSVFDINTAVQKMIDRIMFLRIAEDRGIEKENLLLETTRAADVYAELKKIFGQAVTKYNAGLFAKDDCIDSVYIDDKELKEIIENLYYPRSPYLFDVLPVEILGSIYERFLGKTIRLTAKQVKVEEKPEVKKAGGVYYTPQYIVDYIVQNTVGEKIKGKTPEEIAEIQICDPACGSGSFLIGAYQCLLDYHLAYYTQAKNVQAAIKDRRMYNTSSGAYKLTIAEKQRILTNSIFGVDIDAQAVEVSKLSLYLKLLEGETMEAEEQNRFAHSSMALLPSLEENIKCGNSLIGTDIRKQQDFSFNDDALCRMNPFDWISEFPAVFREGARTGRPVPRSDKDVAVVRGGFDVVLGNPPYVRPHKIDEYWKKYFWKEYKTFVAKSDMYSCFMEKGINILRWNGLIGFIVPITWTSLESFLSIREYILDKCAIVQMAQLPKKVFDKATVETCIFVFKKQITDGNQIINIFRVNSDSTSSPIRSFLQSEIKNSHLSNFQLYGRDFGKKIIEKVKNIGMPLDNYVSLTYGFKTADDEKFLSKKKINKDYKPFIRSADIFRYRFNMPGEYVWYVPEVMIKNKSTARPGNIERFLSEKIIVARMGNMLIASYDNGGLFVKDAMLLLKKSGISLKYILALINSRLMNYYYQEYFVTIDVLKNALLSLPIAHIRLDNASDKQKHDNLVSLVDKMLELKQKEASEQDTQRKNILLRFINDIDKEIDAAVYALYGLTEEEIAIVEGLNHNKALSHE